MLLKLGSFQSRYGHVPPRHLFKQHPIAPSPILHDLPATIQRDRAAMDWINAITIAKTASTNNLIDFIVSH